MEIKRGTRVSIKPFESGEPNGGLEKHNMVVADGVQHKEDLGLIERNGIKCYLTGLNELAPEVQGIKDTEKKEAVIRDIRKTVIFLENSLAGNFEITEKDIDEYDEKGKPTGKLSTTFWSKVTMFISQGPDKLDNKGVRIPTYWDKVEVICDNYPRYLDYKNPHDLILIYAIQAGGFEIVASSLEAARKAVYPPKFYLDKEEETAGIKTEWVKLRNRAGRHLDEMFEKDTTKLLYVTKICSVNSLSYRKSTAPDILYGDCDKYINGETVDKNKKVTAQKFIDTCKLTYDELRVQAIVRDAAEMHLISFNKDGNLYYNKTGSPMGKGINDVVVYLKNPLNNEILTNISTEVEEEWHK